MKYGEKVDQVISLSLQIKTAYRQWKITPGPNIIEGDDTRGGSIIDNELLEHQSYDNSIKLDSTLRNQYESIFNADFSNVKIHTGKYAEHLTRKTGAHAITIGTDIYFGSDKYAPETEEGMKLLAHELQHVIQNQRGDRFVYYEDTDNAEHEADKIEKIISMPLLYTADTYTSNQPSSAPFPDTGDINENNKAPLEKSAVQSVSLDDFAASNKGFFFEVALKDGSKVDMNPAEMTALYNRFEAGVKDWLEEQKLLCTEDKYEKLILRLLNFNGL